MALTLEPNVRQTSSAYKNISLEDYLDILDRTEPESTPLFSLAGTETDLGATEFAWNVDTWPDRAGAEGVADGEAVAAASVRNRAANVRKMGNIGQGFRRPYGAGWIAQRVPRVAGIGRGRLLADAEADAAVLLKQDVDAALGSFDQVAFQDVGSATGGLMAGIFKLVDKSNQYSAASAYAVGKPTDLHYAPTGACVTGALATVFNRAALKTVAMALRQSAQRSGDYLLVAGLQLRQAVTDLTDPIGVTGTATGGALYGYGSQIKVISRAEQESTLGASVDVIQTDFGRIMVTDTRGLGTTTTDSTGGAVDNTTGTRSNRAFVEKSKYGLIVKKGMFAKRWGVAPYSEPLALDGGGNKFDYKGFCSCIVYNPNYFGYFLLT